MARTSRTKTAYTCENCGYDSVKWLGKCPACGQWNTFREVTVAASAPPGQSTGAPPRPAGGSSRPVRLGQVETADEPRTDTGDPELNRVLGGGIVPGSLVLLGGEPGIGKSTLMLQTVMRMAGKRVLYASGEESQRQIKLRAGRIGTATADILLACETSL